MLRLGVVDQCNEGLNYCKTQPKKKLDMNNAFQVFNLTGVCSGRKCAGEMCKESSNEIEKV